jgi:nitroreductase
MNTLEAIETRRAVRTFKPGHEIPDEDVQRLLTLTTLTPSAFNLQHWRFVWVRDPELRRKIRPHAWGQAQITDASALILLCADLAVWRKDARRVWQAADEGTRETMAGMIDQFYGGRDWLQRDDAMRSLGMAAQTLMLAAKAMNYDSCPMDGFDAEAVGRLVGLPEDHVIGMFVAIGKPQDGAQTHPRPYRLPLKDVVTVDRFS